VVAIEGIYCEFKSCYSFVVFLLSFFLSYADQRVKSQFIANSWLQYFIRGTIQYVV